MEKTIVEMATKQMKSNVVSLYSCPTINVSVEFPLCLMNTIVCVLFCSGSSL